MVKFTTLDPIAEAQARAILRQARGKAMHPGAPTIGQAAAGFVRKAAPAAAPGIARLKAQWRDIVGEDIAKYCQPEKLTGKKGDRCLTLRVIPQAAPLVQHRGQEIRQRLSSVAGGVVTRLKIVQGPLSSTAPAFQPRRPRRTLSAAELAELEAKVADIQNAALRAATVSLGKAMLSAQV